MGKGPGMPMGKGPGKGSSADNLYVRGLPAGMTEDHMRQVFGQYVTVASVKVLPMTAGKPDAAGFVRVGSAAEAESLIQMLNGQTLPGFPCKLTIKLADSGG